MTTANLTRIINRVDDLPTLPRTIISISELVNNPQSSARDLAGIITDDQVLTARLLKLVNSAFYGFPRRITTVTGSIVLLGFDAIRNLLLTTSLFDLFSPEEGNNAFQREALWDHSLGCAVGAKVIGAHVGYEKVEELFVSGLLHDIGKIVEMLFLKEEFAEIIAAVRTRNILIKKAEEEVLGYNHADVGKVLAEQWNLPLNHVAVIAHHHEPQCSDKFGLESAIVHLADIFCRSLNIGSGGDRKIPALKKKAFEILGLTINALEPLMEKIETEYSDIRSFAVTP